uniref:Uncharacterized protein n=1 Tax=Zea mays TaxID=4577 RepID=C4J3Q0_MAIZE|nr:unknown [Zea mays]
MSVALAVLEICAAATAGMEATPTSAPAAIASSSMSRTSAGSGPAAAASSSRRFLPASTCAPQRRASRPSKKAGFRMARARKAVHCSCRRSVPRTRRSMSSSCARASSCSRRSRVSSRASASRSRRSVSSSLSRSPPAPAEDGDAVDPAAPPRRRRMFTRRCRCPARKSVCANSHLSGLTLRNPLQCLLITN